MIAYCATCDDDCEFEPCWHNISATVRGVRVAADVRAFRCVACGKIRDDPSHDPMAILYSARGAQDRPRQSDATGLMPPAAQSG